MEIKPMEQRLDRELSESSRTVWLRKSGQLGRRALPGGVLQGEGEVRVKCFGERVGSMVLQVPNG